MYLQDTRASYLISLIGLQLNRRGYLVRREGGFRNQQIDALVELTHGANQVPSLPRVFAIEYKVAKPGVRPGKSRKKGISATPWLNGTLCTFWIYLYPASQTVEVPAPLSKVIRSEQSMKVMRLPN